MLMNVNLLDMSYCYDNKTLSRTAYDIKIFNIVFMHFVVERLSHITLHCQCHIMLLIKLVYT